MKAYHWTPKNNLDSILKSGLRPNRVGIVYLTPNPEPVCGANWSNSICLEVETLALRLTAFDDCKDWEILCWGHIPPENIRIFKEVKQQ